MNDKRSFTPLPQPTVKPVSSTHQQLTDAVLRGVMSNPVYTGVPPYGRVVSDEAWIRSAVQLIEEEGLEQFLVNMLYVLRHSMVDAIPDEAIPAEDDGPWSNGGDKVEEGLNSQRDIYRWLDLMEGSIFCSHDGLPMIAIDDDFLCVSEFLYAHLDGTAVTDLLTEPVLSLIFQNGHTMPLLCPDCGQSLHVDDHEDLLKKISGLAIVDVEWNDYEEALVVEFARLDNNDGEFESGEILVLHLDSVRGLTCPNNQTWHIDDEDQEAEDFLDYF